MATSSSPWRDDGELSGLAPAIRRTCVQTRLALACVIGWAVPLRTRAGGGTDAGVRPSVHQRVGMST